MKKLLVLMVLVGISLSLSATDRYSVAYGMRNNSQVEDNHFFLMEGEGDRFSFTFMETGGEAITFDSEYRGEFSSVFCWDTGVTFNYFSSGTISLMTKGNLNGNYGTESVNLDFGLGAQAAVVKYKYLESPLFSLSPLLNIVLNLKVNDNSFSFGMMMDMKYERQFKAVETIFISSRLDITPTFSLTLDVWGRGAEYLMDPWLNIQGHGIVLKFTVSGEERDV